MRIFAMVHLFPPRHCAGAEMMLVSMLTPLVERGHQVDVLLSRPTPDREPYVYRGITVHPYRTKDDPWPFAESCDVMLSHLENMPRAVVLSSMLDKPLVQVLHNTEPVNKVWAQCKGDILVYNSVSMADEYGNDPRGIIVRPPVFAEDYRTTPGDAVTLINLNEEKGGPLFWELARRFPQQRFLAVKGAYGPQIVRDLSNVEVRQHGGDMRAVYASTRVLLMPSARESWGRVGVEAMCSGIPVIAHPTEGLRESLGEAGTFVDRHDPDAWEQALRRLLDGRRWRAASRKAKARADELDPAEDIDRWCKAVERFERVMPRVA